MTTLFTNVTAITMEETTPILTNGFVAVDGTTIGYVGTTKPQGGFDRTIDCADKILMPGLINAHTHLPMSLLRSYGGGNNLQDWLNNFIFPAEANLDPTCVTVGTTLSVAELLENGVTCVADMYNFCDEIAEVVAQSGISANLSRGVICFDGDATPDSLDGVNETLACIDKWHGFDNNRIKFDVSLHGEYTSFLNKPLWDYMANLAKTRDLGMHIHVSETKLEHDESLARHNKTPLQILDDHKLWDNGGIAAHCVWCDPDDFALMARKNISPVHNPVSNLKLGSGVAPITQMLQAGVNVALGTDGVASNNNHDLFEEIKLTAILHAGVTHNPTAISALQALQMATVNGAKALKRNTGMIAVGKDADIILLDATSLALTPCHDVVENVVYAANGSQVCLTMCRGKVVYENGDHLTLDIPDTLKKLHDYAIPKIFPNK